MTCSSCGWRHHPAYTCFKTINWPVITERWLEPYKAFVTTSHANILDGLNAILIRHVTEIHATLGLPAPTWYDLFARR